MKVQIFHFIIKQFSKLKELTEEESVELLYNEIVYQEVNQHIGENLTKSVTEYNQVIKDNRAFAPFIDDDFKEIFNKMIQSDGIILGSPVYSADVSSRMKAFLERSGVIISTNRGLLKHKIGVSVVAVRRGGALNTVNTMNHFLLKDTEAFCGRECRDAGNATGGQEGTAAAGQGGQGSGFHFLPYVPLEIYGGAERGNQEGNGCPCAKGCDTVILLPGNFGSEDDGDTQEV